jgi:ABC-type uncharacterized transport system permease subunit
LNLYYVFQEKNMNNQMQAAWRKMVGTALLWVALATLVYMPSAEPNTKNLIVAGLGFLFFAAGLALFAEGLKRDIIARLKRT